MSRHCIVIDQAGLGFGLRGFSRDIADAVMQWLVKLAFPVKVGSEMGEVRKEE